MKRTAKKIRLNRETLRQLATDHLAAAGGGGTLLLTCGPRTCGTCPVTCATCGAQDTCAVC